MLALLYARYIITTFSLGPVWKKSEDGGRVGISPREDSFLENSSKLDLGSPLIKCLERRAGW